MATIFELLEVWGCWVVFMAVVVVLGGEEAFVFSGGFEGWTVILW